MSTLSIKNPTMLELAKQINPDGSIAEIAEVLSETNEVFQDMTFVESNGLWGHRHTIRTGLPSGTWRKLYGGVQPERSTTAQITDTIGNLESYSEIDADEVDDASDPVRFRLNEDMAHVEGLGQTMASTVFYGDEDSTPEKFTGFDPRFDDGTAENGDNMINGSGSGSDNASIWLVHWSPKTVFGLYQKGTPVGLQMTDKGLVTAENIDGSNGRAEIYRTHFKWKTGLAVKDWRSIVRVCNIDVSDLGTLANTKNLVTWMTQALERIHEVGGGRSAFYMNRTLREKLRLGIQEKISSQLTWETVGGKRVIVFGGVPVRRCDALLSTESAISFS